MKRKSNKGVKAREVINMKKLIKKITITLLAIIALVISIEHGSNEVLGETKPIIRVGSKNFTENLIVSEIYSLALEDAGYTVERVYNIPGSDIHDSIVNGKIDLYPEYTGTGLLSILKRELITDPQKVYDIVKSEYDKKFDLVWLDYSDVDDSQGLVIRTDVAKELGIKTISDLQLHASKIIFVTQGEFDTREDGMPRLEEVYGKFDWRPVKVKVYDNNFKYLMLSSNYADVAPAYTTEAQLVKDEFTLLEDDKNAWPPYNLAPVVKKSVLEDNPEIEDILNKVSATLNTQNVTRLNAAVDLDKKPYQAVAKEYYDSIK